MEYIISERQVYKSVFKSLFIGCSIQFPCMILRYFCSVRCKIENVNLCIHEAVVILHFVYITG
ncbi:hypothetical protein Barb6_03003 [Bacteroidales bacterium Barb6]|nr:hypothetical protein Barb6_03003 [Bacteroidales bacterium Barb6]